MSHHSAFCIFGELSKVLEMGYLFFKIKYILKVFVYVYVSMSRHTYVCTQMCVVPVKFRCGHWVHGPGDASHREPPDVGAGSRTVASRKPELRTVELLLQLPGLSFH